MPIDTGLNPDELIIGGNQRIHVAPVGTPLPANISSVLDIGFIDLGYTEQTGTKFTDNKTIGKVLPSQSFYPVRYFIQEREAMVDFTLLQWNQATVELAFDGGSWETLGADEFRYIPPDPSVIATKSMVVDATDGTRHFRITIPRGFVTSNTVSTFARTGPALLPITFSVQVGSPGDNPWTIDTDDPLFAAAS